MNPLQEEAWPRVTVNILAYNRRELVRLTLQKTLYELDYPREQLEVIVVDNESSDGTSEMIAADFPDVKVVRIDKNMGVPAWNKGFAAGTGDYFLVLDDDCFITGDSLQKAVRAAQEENADLVSFVVQHGYLPEKIFNDLANTGILEFWGCSVLISRRAVESLHGYDANMKFLSHELEFTMRFFDKGFKHLFLPEVVSQHMKAVLPESDKNKGGDDPHLRLVVIQRERLGYIAGKLLQPLDALAALFNMSIKVLMMMRYGRQASPALLLLWRGFWHGWQNRSPVRPAVSTVYRRNFVEFVSPLRFALPVRAARGGVAHNKRQFCRLRSRFYPKNRATLRL